jgi:hypothetical protein
LCSKVKNSVLIIEGSSYLGVAKGSKRGGAHPAPEP